MAFPHRHPARHCPWKTKGSASSGAEESWSVTGLPFLQIARFMAAFFASAGFCLALTACRRHARGGDDGVRQAAGPRHQTGWSRQ
jgi:hypothetical protein